MAHFGVDKSEGDDADIRELLRDRYYIGVEAAVVASGVIAVALVALLWNHAARRELLAWSVAVAVALPLPPLLKRLQLDVQTWRYFVYPLEFFYGVVWGALPAFVMPADPVYQGIVGAVSASVLLGGSISSSQFLPAFACFTTPLVALFAYGFATHGADGTVNLIWLVLVAWAYGTSVAIDQRHLHLDLIRTARNNEQLVAELEEERGRMVVANDQLATAVAEADRMARTDPLTGLANRLRFDEYLFDALSQLSFGATERVTLAYIDLDDFKAVNDRSGHRVGDKLLASVAQRLLASAADHELVARIGGDELVVVSTDVTAADLGSRVAGLFDDPIALGVTTLSASASVGVASTETAVDGDELIKRADTAQYQAKRAGGGRVVLADPLGSDRTANPSPT